MRTKLGDDVLTGTQEFFGVRHRRRLQEAKGGRSPGWSGPEGFGGNKRNPEGASTNLHPLGALTPGQVEPESPTHPDSGIVPKIFAVVSRHRETPSARRLWGVYSLGATTRRSPAGSILSDPAGETAVLLLRVDPHTRSEVSLRPCGACRFPSKHQRNVDHETGFEFEFGFPDFASG